MAKYQEELRNFQQQWNLPSYDLNELANSPKGLRYAEAFLTGSSIDVSPTGEYVRCFSKTLEWYFEMNTTPNGDGKYMSSFDPQAFYDSFKNLVQAKYDADAQEKNETPLKVKDVVKGQKDNIEKIIAKGMSKYQKTLPAMWMDNLKSKKWDIQELENLTTNATETMYNYTGDKADMEGNLTSVVVAYEAMRILRESRGGFWGWWWKLFNSTRNEQEETYFLKLESQLSMLDAEGYQIDRVIIDKTSKTMLGEAVESRYKVIEKEYEERNNQANLEDSNLDINVGDLNKQEVQEYTLSAQLMEKAGPRATYQFTKKISPSLPKPILGGEDMVKFGVEQFVGEVMKEFDAFNKKYETQMKEGKKETAMAEYALKVFSIALVSTQQIEFDGAKESIITAQKVTDAFLKQFSPCSMDESLQKFADNYAIKNFDKIIDSLKAKVEPFLQDRLDEGFKDVREELFPQERAQVFGDGKMFVENDGSKSLPVNQQPKPNVPTLNNGNK